MSATASAERQELKNYIDVIPEQSIVLVRNFLSYLYENSPSHDEPLVIEPADAEETAMIEEGMREYDRNPESFITLDEYKRSRGI